MAVDPDTQLEIAPDGSGRDTFTQAGGLVAAAGAVVVDGGLFHFSGGGLMGDFTVRDGWIRVDSTVTQPSTIYVVGHGNVLLDNAGAVALRVQGGSPLGDGDAVLTAADGATNRGAIVLESLDGVHHGYFRVPAGRFTNAAGGVIQVSLPPGESGAGSVTAGTLEGDGGAVADATGLPVDPQYQAALDAGAGGGGRRGRVVHRPRDGGCTRSWPRRPAGRRRDRGRRRQRPQATASRPTASRPTATTAATG